MLCSPDNRDAPTDTLQQDYFGMHRFEWPNWPSVEFHITYGDMIRLLRANGFEIENLIELRPTENAKPFIEFPDTVSFEWTTVFGLIP